ncbi:class F sortase [Streptomyces sp. NPDC058274]|uniref:class F sortase n=1 Tax=Streptomyces sp. NPDC058274 TaxID=3346416 RepID=UPI0036ED6155
MAPRRRRRRPWYRTRAYRLTRTFAILVALVVGGVCWAGDDEPVGPVAADGVGHGGAEASSGPAARGGSDARGAQPRRAARVSPARTAPPARPTPPPRPAPPPRPLSRSLATGFRIPYLGLDVPVVQLRLERNRELATPPVDNPKLVGWFESGPSPGENGTAVVVGHRDTRTGPAVFAGLGMLRTGRLIEARRADGRTAVYTVDAVRTYEKAHFPDKEVYGGRGRPELRLITCGGTYNRKTGYASNVVVFAHLTGTREAGAPSAPPTGR